MKRKIHRSAKPEAYSWSRPTNYDLCPVGRNNLEVVQAVSRVSERGNAYWLITAKTTVCQHAYIWETILTGPSSPPLTDKSFRFHRDRLAKFIYAMGRNPREAMPSDPNLFSGRRFSADIIHQPNLKEGGLLDAKVHYTRFSEYDPKHDIIHKNNCPGYGERRGG